MKYVLILILKYHLQLQVSLILEYCSNGDLRTFLIKHNKELAVAILATNHETNIQLGPNGLKMDIFLLIVWSYQVLF